MPDITVIMLTYNEELNLPQALQSVKGWANQVIVVDSFSTDRTIEIAKEFCCRVYQHPFENYSRQRNYTLGLPIETEWVLFLDADEWLPQELKNEITSLITSHPLENGFYIKRRFIWMGRWVRRGYYPAWILRLFRYGKARCEERGINEHLIVEGVFGYLKNDFIHEGHKDLSEWISKHNRYATQEAEELLKRTQDAARDMIIAKPFGTQPERKRWLRHHVWKYLPPLIRPFFYFGYRYVLCGGFLDGREAFIFHFLQALWFPLLTDAKYIEQRRRHKMSHSKYTTLQHFPED